jgi:hypothetical protein
LRSSPNPLSQVKVDRGAKRYGAKMEPSEASDQLTLSLETAFFIIVKAREFDEQVPPSDPDSGSNPSDDREVDVLEEDADDTVEQELDAALAGLNIDQQLDLMALTWLGRGDFASFAEARKEANDMRDKHIAIYLKGTPKLGDYLEEGLAQLGYSLEDFEKNRL